MSTAAYETALEALRDRLGERSIAHSIAVAEESSRIAGLYGVDQDAARLAGLLHDWARDDADDVLLDDAAKYRVSVVTVDQEVPYLLHARTGARGVAEAFPDIDDDVLAAVEHHTLGTERMGELSMVVYIADMTSADRQFDGVDELRAAIGVESLDAVFRDALAHTLKHVIDARKRLHPRSVDAWNDLVMRETL